MMVLLQVLTMLWTPGSLSYPRIVVAFFLAPPVLRELYSVGNRTMAFQGCPQPDVLGPASTLLFIMTVFGRYG